MEYAMSNVPRHADEIERRVVGMYERHPFPAYSDKFRKASEEMYLKMRLLGFSEEDYRNKKILDCGCGTGEFTCWYAAQGNEVTGIDLSEPSLRHARAYAEKYDLDDRIEFVQKSVLELDLPEDSFEIVYSYGVLHHTADPYQGFQNMVRVCKPGGVVIVSVYSRYSRALHNLRRAMINRIAGEDVEKRLVWGRRLFPFTARKLKLRAHDESNAILYDQFSIPHESQHSVGEILSWLDENDLDYIGAFGPLRVRDYVRAAALPEYQRFETTFAGYRLSRLASRVLKIVARLGSDGEDSKLEFERPSIVSRFLVQSAWLVLGLRFSCFSIAGRKRAASS